MLNRISFLIFPVTCLLFFTFTLFYYFSPAALKTTFTHEGCGGVADTEK